MPSGAVMGCRWVDRTTLTGRFAGTFYLTALLVLPQCRDDHRGTIVVMEGPDSFTDDERKSTDRTKHMVVSELRPCAHALGASA